MPAQRKDFDPVRPEFRACTKCGETKPLDLDHFPKYKKNFHGLATACRVCTEVGRTAWRKRNMDRVREQGRAWSAAHPGYYRDLYHRDVERQRERGRKKYAENRESYLARCAEYRQKPESKEKLRATYHRHRARKKAAEIVAVTAADFTRIRERQKGKCYWCRKRINGLGEMDHVIPLAKGGDHSPGNLVLACVKCNRSKNARMPSDWAGRLL